MVNLEIVEAELQADVVAEFDTANTVAIFVQET